MELTRELARVAALDAGNCSMRAAGRTEWSEDDAAECTKEFDRLWPLEKDLGPGGEHREDDVDYISRTIGPEE